jgi:hypothetical protein
LAAQLRYLVFLPALYGLLGTIRQPFNYRITIGQNAATPSGCILPDLCFA